MSVRPSSLPPTCSRFRVNDGADDPVNFRRRQLGRIFGDARSQSLRRSDSLPTNFGNLLEASLGANSGGNNDNNSAPTGTVCFDLEDAGATQDPASVIEANTTVLAECENKVIRFYHWSLTLIGWCPTRSRAGEVANIFWTIFIVLCLFISYSYQVLICQWECQNHDTSNHSEVVNTSVNDSWLMLEKSTPAKIQQLPCKHLISLYLLPNFLHFVAYLIGCWHFRTNIELVEALTQKLFMSSPHNSTRKFVRHLRFYFYFAFLWAVLSVIANMAYDVSNHNHKNCKMLSDSGSVCSLIWVIEVLGNCFSFNVSSVIAFNFVAQGEIVIANISGLLAKLQMRLIGLQDARKDVCALRRNVALLNGAPALMTSLLTFITADLTITGAVMLSRRHDGEILYNFYFWMFVIRFLPVALFPVLQAVRVNRHCQKLKHAALEIRANGYRDASMLDMDSFLLFAITSKFSAKLFGLGFRGAHFTLVFAFTLTAYLCMAKPFFV